MRCAAVGMTEKNSPMLLLAARPELDAIGEATSLASAEWA
jgi:hypothetical protein